MSASGQPRWVIVGFVPDEFRIAEWLDDRYVAHAYLPSHSTYDAARGVLVAMGWAGGEVPQSEADLKQALREAREAVESMRGGGLCDQQEIKRLREECNREAERVSRAMGDYFEALQREDALLLLARQVRDVLPEVLAALDEAYLATGYSKVAATSQQRLRVEEVIGAIAQLLRASPRQPRGPADPAKAEQQRAEADQQLATLWQQLGQQIRSS